MIGQVEAPLVHRSLVSERIVRSCWIKGGCSLGELMVEVIGTTFISPRFAPVIAEVATKLTGWRMVEERAWTLTTLVESKPNDLEETLDGC